MSNLFITDLRVEQISSPLGMTESRPRFSWEIEAESGVYQAAYRILVASSPRLLPNNPDVWDSGLVTSNQSILVGYQGVDLESRKRYLWQVKVLDIHGLETTSELAWWEMGLMMPKDWHGTFVGIPRPLYSNADHRPIPHLRRVFDLSNYVSKARLYATAAGVYEVHLNGKRVGNRHFRPGYTDYNQRVYVDTYDVTNLLQKGRNVIGAMIADGWYAGSIGFEGRRELYGNQLGFLAQLEVDFVDGTRLVLATDRSWEGCFGPVLASDFHAGETCDMRRNLQGWDSPTTEDGGHGWVSVKEINAPKGSLIGSIHPPVIVTTELKPKGITILKNGDIRVDFGQNFAGWVRLKLNGFTGQIVRILHGEAIDCNGNLYVDNLDGARSSDTIILDGKPSEWEPLFTYHGFRYAEITGLSQPIEPRDITGRSAHSNVEFCGEFECSDSTLTRLVDLMRWTMRSNLVDIWTGSPQRDERLGWTGDPAGFLPTAMYLADMRGLLAKWLEDIRESQYENGSFPVTAPVYRQLPPEFRTTIKIDLFRPSAGYSDAFLRLVREAYRYSGDRRLLERNLPNMARWVDFVAKMTGESLICRPEYNLILDRDWLETPPDTPQDLFTTAFFAHSAGTVAWAAREVGNTTLANFYGDLSGRIRNAFINEFVGSDGSLPGDTQTAYTLTLAFGLMPVEFCASAAERLAGAVRRQQRITTGVHATRFLFPVLAEHGYNALALDLATSNRHPSFSSWLRGGLTTIPEWLDAVDANGDLISRPGNSLNQVAMGSIGEWLFGALGGISPLEPGWKTIQIAPRPAGSLRWARVAAPTPYGQVSCAWERSNGILRLEVSIPSNTTAVLDLSEGSHLLEPGRHRLEFPEPPDDLMYPYPFARDI